MAKPKRFEEWEEKAVKDYDPEVDPADDSQASGSDEEGADLAGTEHYESVGKSKLRRKENVSLGPQYRGARVSRQDLEDGINSEDDSDDFEDAQEELGSSEVGSDEEQFDDPETADLATDEARFGNDDVEIESDDALCDSDDEKLNGFSFRGSATRKDAGGMSKKKQRPTAADFISDSEEEVNGEDLSEGSGEEGESDVQGTDEDSSEEDDEEGDGDEIDSSAEEEDGEDTAPGSRGQGTSSRSEQRKLMNEGRKALVATMSAAAQQDAQKGQSVRQQRRVFDGLLNIRIRLQKAMVATNSFSASNDEDEDEEVEPYEAAEAAALKLLETLDSVRSSILPSQIAAGEKRKRGQQGESTTAQALWQDLKAEDERAAKYRKKVLENWSNKTKHTTVEVKSRNLVSSRQSIISTLEDQLIDTDRLIKRTRTPRSCAPVQAAKKVNEDENIYDDADFYQLLLKELVNQRTADETAALAGNASLATVKLAAMKEAKTKKHVDRRASKGRKMRFNIHEKLQNFMAPEDRRSWEQDAIDRLFGTLFGQKMELNEGDGGDISDEDMDDGINAEEDGLRLFRDGA